MKSLCRFALCLLLIGSLRTATAAEAGGPADFSAYDDAVRPVVARMTLHEKVGQMTQAELLSLGDLSDVRELCLGSVLSGGDSDPPNGNSVEDWAAIYEACQDRARRTRLGVPLLYGVDAVHGHNNVSGAVIFPHNIGLGCTRDAELVEEIGRLTAGDMLATGVQWAFAPCVTVPRDDRWGRTYEGFSEDPELVAELGAAAVRGLQGERLGASGRVLACAKHFVADGGTLPVRRESHHGHLDAGVRLRLDQGDATISECVLREVHVRPYKDAIAAGVGSIMPSYSSWNGEKCTGSRRLLTEMLKGELGFEGFLISDYAAIDQVDPDYRAAIAKCVNAGIDMAMTPYSTDFHDLLVELMGYLGGRRDLARLIHHEALAGGEHLQRLAGRWLRPMYARALAALERSPRLSDWEAEELPLLLLTYHHLIFGHFAMAGALGAVLDEDLASDASVARQTRFLQKVTERLLGSEPEAGGASAAASGADPGAACRSGRSDP